MTIAGRTALGQSLFATTLIASLPRISAIKGISETVSKRQRASESILALDLCPAASNHPYAFYPASFHGADRKHVRNIRGGNP